MENYIKPLVQFKFQINLDLKNYVLLKKAIQSGQKQKVKTLLESGVKVNIEDPEDHTSTPLHLAVALGCPEIVRLLLNRGALINLKNANEESPLILAAKMGKELIMRYLLSVQNHKNCSNRENLSHTHIACMANSISVVKILIQQGARINHAVKMNSLHWPGFTPLHFAVQYQSIETVEFLLRCGADITIQNQRKLTPLHLAFHLGNNNIIDLILSYHRYEIRNPINSEGLSHFHIACTRNNFSLVQSFITHGADVNMKVYENALNWRNFTPVHFAICYDSIDVIKLLLTYNINLQTEDLIDPIYFALSSGNEEIVYLLQSRLTIKKSNSQIKNLLNPNVFSEIINETITADLTLSKSIDTHWSYWTGYTPLHLAVKLKNYKIIELLLKQTSFVVMKDARGETPLHIAFRAKQMGIVDLILSVHTKIDENPEDTNGLSHFHIACITSKLQIVEKFLKSGIDVNRSVKLDSGFWPGYTALHFACHLIQNRVIQLLLDSDADISIKNGIQLTPLDLAILNFEDDNQNINDSISVLELILLKLSFKNLYCFNDRGFSLIHIYSMNNDLDSMKNYLNLYPETLNKKINWSKSLYYGFTPLHFAINFGHDEVAQLLLETSSNIFLKDKLSDKLDDRLFGLILKCNYKIKESQLCSVNVNDTDSKDNFYFHMACEFSNSIDIVYYFLNKGVCINEQAKINKAYDCGTPLHYAVRNLKIGEKLVEIFLSKGADIHARDSLLETPLHYAIKNRHYNTIKVLVSHGANVNVQNLYGNTPLHFIRYDSHSSPEIASFLLENGADINIKNETGETPFTMIETVIDNSYKYECFLVMIKHIRKLISINYHVIEKNLDYYGKISTIIEQQGIYKDNDFFQQCMKEIQLLKKISINKYTSLYNLLFKNPNHMALHSKNDLLKEIIESDKFNNQFPMYSFLIKLQIKKGLERRPLFVASKKSLNFLTQSLLPETCLENIIHYMTSEDLKNIVQTVIEVNKQFDFTDVTFMD